MAKLDPRAPDSLARALGTLHQDVSEVRDPNDSPPRQGIRGLKKGQAQALGMWGLEETV